MRLAIACCLLSSPRSLQLLSRRDSGFGLLWLAATLGAKSSFKKLPRRSVLTADIAQLCGLIAEPEEPLALRLSSNLMVGVVRVYKVKQDIFFTDVTLCYNTLKKAVSEIHATNFGDLQMGQPAVRPDAVTLAADPTAALAMDLEHLFQGWDDRERTQRPGDDGDNDSDGDFDPTQKGKRKRTRTKASSISAVEAPRVDAHTLKENHDFMFNSSFVGPDSAMGGVISSSSQFGGGFGFDDNFDLGDIGDELARELGEGWGASATPARQPPTQGNDGDIVMSPIDQDFILNPDEFGDQARASSQGAAVMENPVFNEETGLLPEGSIIVPLSPFGQSPAQEGEADLGAEKQPKKGKRVRLLLDARTELTNEELERARANYMEGQALLRREFEQKRSEKGHDKLLDEMLWGAPRGVNAPALVDFWHENFRLQVEARSGQLHLEAHGEPPRKRRRVNESGALEGDDDQQDGPKGPGVAGEADFGMDFGIGMDDPFNAGTGADFGNEFAFGAESHLRSSEEPGQARRASRPPSVTGSHMDFGLERAPERDPSSQKSNMFPWDHAGASSSISGVGFVAAGSDRISLGRASQGRRGSSLNQESPLPPGVAESPASLGFRSTDPGFNFELPEEVAPGADESQRSDASVLTLEKNSYNFLEYAKMQLQAVPSASPFLKFDHIVPNETSTRHVASAAFYHCLVLATKDLLGVEQDIPYGSITITVK